MDLGHALLQSAWESGDDAVDLLIFADWLDERGDGDPAELLRLVVAEAATSRHCGRRAARLKQLREDAWKSVRGTSWPGMAVQGNAGAAAFSRRPDPALPDREHIVVRPDRRTVHRFLVGLDGEDEVVRTAEGRELLRRRLPNETLAFIRGRGDLYRSPAFALAQDYFFLSVGWHADPEAAEAEQVRRLEAALAPAAIPVADLPGELVPFVAWILCEFLTDRGRRARSGEVVPGAHLFLFRPADGGWGRAQSFENRESGRAVGLLRQRFRRGPNGGRGVLAGLLVRVADDGGIAARKLVWVDRDGHDCESPNLPPRPASTVPAAEFRRAADDMEMDSAVAGRFVLDDDSKLRGLFRCSADVLE